MCKILIVEDDRQTNLAICEYLCSIGYTTLSAFDGSEALSIFSQNTIDLIILDIMLPKKSGLDVLHQIRDSSLVPILMLTAIQDECTQINSFDLQADDYIVKPFSMILLGKRIGALIRRFGNTAPLKKLTVGNNVVVDFDGYTAVGESGKIDITPKEIDLLRLLIEHKGFIYEAYSILSGHLLEAAFQSMLHQFRSAAAHFAEPKAGIGAGPSSFPSPFQSGCRSRRWPAHHRLYWQTASSSCPSQRA